MHRDITYTAADYRALPESAPRMELLDGDFEVTPAPSPRHQTIVGNAYRLLSDHSKTHPIGKLFFAPCDVYLGDTDVLQPDIFLLSPAYLDRERSDGIYGAPDLVVEVLSPATGARDLTLKREIYRRAGVAEYWVIDPASETVQVHRLQDSAAPGVFTRGDSISSTLLRDFAGTVDVVFA